MKFVVMVFFMVICAFLSSVNAATVSDLITSGGSGKHIDFFTNFDPSETWFVYDELNGSSTTTGMVNTAELEGKKTVQISLPTLNSTSITIRAEGMSQGSSTWYEIYTDIFTTALAIDTPWPIAEYINKVRIGVKVVGDAGGDDLSIVADFARGTH